MLNEFEYQQIHAIQSPSEEKAKADKLPGWVKCMYCGERPRWGDLLGEVIPNSSALAHESCMKEHGKIFGLNAGMIPTLEKGYQPKGD